MAPLGCVLAKPPTCWIWITGEGEERVDAATGEAARHPAKEGGEKAPVARRSPRGKGKRGASFGIVGKLVGAAKVQRTADASQICFAATLRVNGICGLKAG